MTDFRNSTGTDTPQTALARGPSVGVQFPLIIEGVVVGIHYPEDAENKSKSEIEYDVDPTSVPLRRLYNVPRGDLFGGVDDGDDSILRVAAEHSDGRSNFVPDFSTGQAATPRLQTSGDRVLLGFVNGSIHRPVILGLRAHYNARSTRRLLRDVSGVNLPRGRKRFRRLLHKGTEFILDESGNASLTFAKTPDDNGDLTNDSKKLTISIGDFKIVIDNSSSPTTLRVSGPSGDLLKITKNSVDLGVGGESMVLGDALTNLLNSWKASFEGHTHGLAAVPVVTGTPPVAVGTATGTTSAPLSQFASPNVTSAWAKVSRNHP